MKSPSPPPPPPLSPLCALLAISATGTLCVRGRSGHAMPHGPGQACQHWQPQRSTLHHVPLDCAPPHPEMLLLLGRSYRQLRLRTLFARKAARPAPGERLRIPPRNTFRARGGGKSASAERGCLPPSQSAAAFMTSRSAPSSRCGSGRRCTCACRRSTWRTLRRTCCRS